MEAVFWPFPVRKHNKLAGIYLDNFRPEYSFHVPKSFGVFLEDPVTGIFAIGIDLLIVDRHQQYIV